MIELYSARTGNGLRAAIVLAESGLPYTVHLVDLRGGEHKRDDYLALNPTGRIPMLVERQADGETGLVLTMNWPRKTSSASSWSRSVARPTSVVLISS